MIHYHSYQKPKINKRHITPLRIASAFAVVIALYVFSQFFTSDDQLNAHATVIVNEAHVPKARPDAENNIVINTKTPVKIKDVELNEERDQEVYAQLTSIQQSITEMLERERPAEKKVVVGKGDTLVGLLVNKASVPTQDAYKAVEALKKLYDPRDIAPGHEITVFFHKEPYVADPKFKGLRFEKDLINTFTVNLSNNGEYKANKLKKSLRRSLRAYKGTIDSSLYASTRASGIPNAVIVELIRMYSWNVDFQRDIRSGNKFEIMYEEYRTEDGDIISNKGNILYAKLEMGKEELPFYRFQNTNGLVDYYDANGRSAKKTLMKTPIDGARLTSGFGYRKHPVLGYSKLHKGLDFAAPRGTPIYAAGDGKIKKIGHYGSYGKYIKIKHMNGIETAYAHMKGFKRGLKNGSKVKQGQVIGYVGTTGRSTGPHLHYEVIKNRRQLNPKDLKLPLGTRLKGKTFKRFKSVIAKSKKSFKHAAHKTELAENSLSGQNTSKN